MIKSHCREHEETLTYARATCNEFEEEVLILHTEGLQHLPEHVDRRVVVMISSAVLYMLWHREVR